MLLAAAALVVAVPSAASAHPLGNFTVNTADRLVVTADGLVVTHVVDLAEIPTVQLGQARSGVDVDDDGTLSGEELTAYAERECARTAEVLSLEVDGADVPLSVATASGTSRPGAAGLATTRIECTYATEVRPEQAVSFADPVALERNGWREVTAASLCGPLQGSTAPTTSPSDLLTAYPKDLLQSPLDVTRASFQVDAGAPCTSAAAAGGVPTDEVAPRGVDRLTSTFTDFLGRTDLTLPFALVSVAASVLFGVLHAVAPGHGKTVMAAYLVGQRGTRRQALQLGAVVTFTHTASVLLLGLVLSLGALAAPELVVPFTEVLSGVLLAFVGVYLAVLALRRLRGGDDHEHPHEHEHDGHDLPHDDHEHDHPHEDHDHPHDDHGHDHPHDEDHDHPPALVGVAVAVEARPIAHTHGGRAHTHAPLPDGPLSWKALAGMGVAGGLVPSPSALLVLLGATALGRAWFGVLLVIAYGVGMAVTLTLAGLLLLRARAVLDRRGWTLGRGARLVRLLPLGTAGVVVVVGLALVLRGVLTGRGLL
ncbi:MAG: high frequency lysogenization protein HflD [Frankiaceae bacterium]|nr:high frequency lysogenization protein HflD [Frankiaceae bacterium]